MTFKPSVLVNGLALNDRFTGVGYYVENLVKAMSNLPCSSMNINFLASTGYKGKVSSGGPVNLLPSRVNSKSRLNRIWFENWGLRKTLKNERCRLYHSPSYLLPVSAPLPSIVTVHDLIAINNPEYSKNETAVYHWFLQKRSLISAKRIIAVSNTVKNDIIRKFNIDERKISVIYHGVTPEFRKISSSHEHQRVRNKYALPEKYILYVGNVEPKKNLSRLCAAFNLIKRNSDAPQKLVIAGKPGWKCKEVFKTIEALRLQNEIRLLGYVEECDLPCIYSLADLFVFPSLYEGFGIPALEAMACETPVLVSNRGALPEITGKVCRQIDPVDVDGMSQAIIELLNDNSLRNKSVHDGKQWVKSFSWEKAARLTLDLYEEVLQY